MTRCVINKCYGGFGLSEKAVKRYFEIINKPIFIDRQRSFGTRTNSYYFCEPSEYHKVFAEAKKSGDYSRANELYFCDYRLERDDPVLVQVVEELGKEANDNYAELKIVEIPSDLDYEIQNYDGLESIHERHSVWA